MLQLLDLRWVYGLENCRVHYMNVWFVAVLFFFLCIVDICSVRRLVVGWLLFHRCIFFFRFVWWRFLFRFWISMMPGIVPHVDRTASKRHTSSIQLILCVFFKIHMCVAILWSNIFEQFRNYIENIEFVRVCFLLLFLFPLSKRLQLCSETREQCNLMLMLFEATKSADVYEGQTILNHFQSAYY